MGPNSLAHSNDHADARRNDPRTDSAVGSGAPEHADQAHDGFTVSALAGYESREQSSIQVTLPRGRSCGRVAHPPPDSSICSVTVNSARPKIREVVVRASRSESEPECSETSKRRPEPS
jgi:hypothetical protein